MRLIIRPTRLIVLAVVIGSGWLAARADDSAALATLKAKGLTRSGRTFVLEAEGPALAKIKEARSALAAYTALADRQAEADQVAAHFNELEERRTELQSGLNDLNQRINEQGHLQAANSPGPGRGGSGQGAMISQMITRRDQIQVALGEITAEQKPLKAQVSTPQARTASDEYLKKKGEAFKATLADLRPLIDEVTKKYATMGADPSVKAAINEVETATKADLKLGPSDAFLAGVKALDQAERRLLGKKTTPVSKKKARAKK